MAGFLALSVATGCSTQSDGLGAPNQNDPIEPLNRIVYSVNDALDTLVLQPVSFLYKESLPSSVQDGVQSFLRWLRSPVLLANDLMQGDLDQAEVTASRAAINTVALGTYDLAAEQDLEFRDEDFGQTLGVHGVGEGPYIMLPVFGPSNARDTVGRVVDHFLDPFTYLFKPDQRTALAITRGVLGATDFRARNFDQVNDLKRSVDPYARLRSIYRQQREAAISNGAPPLDDTIPDLSEDFDVFTPSYFPGDETGTRPIESPTPGLAPGS